MQPCDTHPVHQVCDSSFRWGFLKGRRTSVPGRIHQNNPNAAPDDVEKANHGGRITQIIWNICLLALGSFGHLRFAYLLSMFLFGSRICFLLEAAQLSSCKRPDSDRWKVAGCGYRPRKRGELQRGKCSLSKNRCYVLYRVIL